MRVAVEMRSKSAAGKDNRFSISRANHKKEDFMRKNLLGDGDYQDSLFSVFLGLPLLDEISSCGTFDLHGSS